MSLPLDKSSIRTSLLKRRLSLSREEIINRSLRAQKALITLPVFERARTLALYSPIRNEVETDLLLSAALAAGKRVCYPSVSGDDLRFFQVRTPENLGVGCFGICEPEPKNTEVDAAAIELLLIPGVAFDLQGSRLGYGRGYFDRFLSNYQFNGLRVGLCYDFQIQKHLPAEPHDQRVTLLVTEQGIYSPL